jgi:RNA polymerase sigma-70 factor (ECF subfamily)
MSEPSAGVALLSALRRGDAAAQEDFVRCYRPWLRLLADLEMNRRLQGKFDASDVVQQALLEACRDLPRFQGETESELSAWLRTILAHVLAHEIRRYRGTRRRDLDREVSLEQTLAQSSMRLGGLLAAPHSSPSQHAVRHEEERRLASTLERLPPDYREVLVLRHLEDLPHEEIARRLGRSPGAVRMLWVRALARLRQELAEN